MAFNASTRREESAGLGARGCHSAVSRLDRKTPLSFLKTKRTHERTGEASMSYYDLGPFSRPVTTTSEAAQTWFDRGLNWTYAYNHAEANAQPQGAGLRPHAPWPIGVWPMRRDQTTTSPGTYTTRKAGRKPWPPHMMPPRLPLNTRGT